MLRIKLRVTCVSTETHSIVMGASFGSFFGITSNVSTNYNRMTNTIVQHCGVTSSANNSNNNYILTGDNGVTINTINIGATNCDLSSVMSNNVANGTQQTNADKPDEEGVSVPGIGVMNSLGISFNVATNITSTINTNSAICNASSSANFTNNNVIITNSKDITFNTANKSPTQCSLAATATNMAQNTTGQSNTIAPVLGSSITAMVVILAAIAMVGTVISAIAGGGGNKSGTGNSTTNSASNSGNNDLNGNSVLSGNNVSVGLPPPGAGGGGKQQRKGGKGGGGGASQAQSQGGIQSAAESGGLETEAVGAVEADPELLALAA